MEKLSAVLTEALRGLQQSFLSVDELARAGEEGTLVVMHLPFDYDFEFQQMHPEHPMSRRHERIKAADTIRDLSLERKSLFTAEILCHLHRSLFDCCSTVRLSIAESLTAAGDKSSIAYLERLARDEKQSPMVTQQVEAALSQLRKLQD